MSARDEALREVIARAVNGFSDCDGEAGFRACGLCTCRGQADAILAALDAAGLAVVDRADLGDVLDDLAAHLDAEHGVSTGGPHPIVAHRYHRDMAPVRRLRAMLAAAAKGGER
jgi:hypothetical protein